MTTRTRVGLGVGGFVLALLVAFGWYFFGSSPEEEVSLEGAVGAIEQPTATDAPSAAETEPGTLTAEDVDGTWTVQSNDSGEVNDGSFVGYRIDEELENVGSATATGRSPGISGEIVIEEGVLVSGRFVADMTSLESDRGFRDRALASRAIEYDAFPTATFTVTDAAQLDVDALVAGTSQTVSVTGELELHGVVNSYLLDLEVQAVGATVVVVGSVDILLSDHAIEKPIVGPVLGIADVGTLELQVFLAKA